MVSTRPGLGELILVHRCWRIQDDIPLWNSKLTTEFIKNSLDWCRKDFHFCYYTLFLQSAYGLWTGQWSSTHQSDCWMGTRDKSQVYINNHQYKVNVEFQFTWLKDQCCHGHFKGIFFQILISHRLSFSNCISCFLTGMVFFIPRFQYINFIYSPTTL